MRQDDRGSIWTWDSNKYSQCGQPVAGNLQNTLAATCLPASKRELVDLVSEPTKIDLPDFSEVADIAAKSEHSAAVPVDGRVLAWDWGGHGQLGSGDTASACQLKQVIVPTGLHVSSGSGFTFAVAKGSWPKWHLFRKHNLALDAVCRFVIYTRVLQKCPVLSVQVF